MLDRKILLRKVAVAADGRLLFDHRPPVIEPVDDAWWHDVMHDPRARTPIDDTRIAADSPAASWRLDRIRGDQVGFACLCGSAKVMDKAKLIDQFKGDVNVHWLARQVFPCNRKNKLANGCRAYFVR